MQLTILCDNSVKPRPGLIGEHGFSCHIATEKHNYLFDTGNGQGLLNNAQICGIDLSTLDAVLLSHGHWDHCGGLVPLLKLRGGEPLTVYAHPAIFEQKIRRHNGEETAIGTGFSREKAEALGAIFHLSSTPVKLSGGLLFSGEIPRHIKMDPDKRIFCRLEHKLIPDLMSDDQSLYLQDKNGLSILCGCAHAGVRNIIAHAIDLTKDHCLYGLIGGLHLMFAESEQRDIIITDLQRYNFQFLALSHCTGDRAVSQLMSVLDEHVHTAAVGCQFTI